MESLQIKAQEIIDELKETSVIDFAEAYNMSALPTRLLSTLQTPYDLTKMAYVVYLWYLVDMFHTRFPIRKSAAMLSEEKDVPLVVMRHLLALYTDSTQNDKGHMTYLQAKAQKDKLILYMLVVALTINGFSLDLTEVSADLKKTPAAYVSLALFPWKCHAINVCFLCLFHHFRLTAYCRQLGCSVDKVRADAAAIYGATSLAKKQVTRVVLALPLQFPLPKRAAGPRR